MRLLVTGAAGMLGRDVVAAAGDAGHEVVALARADLDITDAPTVGTAVRAAAPDAVINCAAWTDVDGAEADETAATAVNGAGAGHVAAAAAEAGALLVQVSSDYVFDGLASEPYAEDAPTAPRSAYGRSKLAGEHAVAPHRSAVVRASWLFGPHGRNFVDTMRRLGAERDEVAVVDDQVGCPTYTGHLAPALVAIAEHGLTGILHVAGGGRCSWLELAEATFEEAGLSCRVRPQSTAELGRPAPRPAFSALRSTRADAPVLPHWRDGLRAHLARAEVVV
ncbi:MAG: dTDP-4-dehydrorhamnose reductase [Solirubrobacteraceae bacterium]